MAVFRVRYIVAPVEFPGTVHVASSWIEALDWIRQYPEHLFAKPAVYDRSGREVRYVR